MSCVCGFSTIEKLKLLNVVNEKKALLDFLCFCPDDHIFHSFEIGFLSIEAGEELRPQLNFN